MSAEKTLEGKVKTRNGIKRLFFVALSFLAEILIVLLLVTALSSYEKWINIAIRAAATVIVLVLYGKNKTSSLKMPWIVLILTIPIIGTALYFLIGMNGGTKRMRKRYAKINEIIFKKLPSDSNIINKLAQKDLSIANIARYITAHSNYPLYQNSDVIYFDSAEKGLEAQLEEMKKAEKFIFMEYYAIENASVWRKIEKVLVEKVAQGVEVRVFYDDLGSISFINSDFASRLLSLGIDCRVFNPFAPGLNVFLNNRDHRKLTVVDGKVGFTGGYNLAEEYFNITSPFGKWKDSGVKITGEAVKSLTMMFLEMWNAVKRSDKSDTEFERFLPETEYTANEDCFIQPYADIPIDDEQIGEEVYISLLNRAERYCYLMSPYLIITDEMSHAISLAAKRGVDVRIVTPGIPDKKMVYRVTRSFYSRLVVNGVKIYEWTPGFCHAKMCVVDDKMAVCGTINLDYRSLYHHFEDSCFIAFSKSVFKIRKDFEKTFSESREVTENYKGRKSVIRLSDLVLRLFAGMM